MRTQIPSKIAMVSQPGASVPFKTAAQNEDGDGTADDCGEKPDGLKSGHTAGAAHEQSAVKVGQTDGENERANEG